MAAQGAMISGRMKIAHVFRAPLGGLFRHVLDLAGAQVAQGHSVGMFFDADARTPGVEAALAKISGPLTLGVSGAPITRSPHGSDVAAIRKFYSWLREVEPDVVHGHGSKGGLYARLSGMIDGARAPLRAYTPHGGSFNYRPGSAANRLFMLAEKALALRTDVFLFESAFIASRFDDLVHIRHGARAVVANGIGEAEFEPAVADADAADLLYVGELRSAKGIDTLLDALALAGRIAGVIPSAVLVGSGPDKEQLMAQAKRLGIENHVSFPGPLPVRQAFKLGRCLVVPSRAESMPYIVLEAAGARVPMIANRVGGIPEIFGPYAHWLGPADDAANLCRRIVETLHEDASARDQKAQALSNYVARHFSINAMVEAVMAGYRAGYELRHRPGAKSRAALVAPEAEI